MESNILAISKKVKNREREPISMEMAVNGPVNGKTIDKTDTENIDTLMEIS
jgi:hypothetical protein